MIESGPVVDITTDDEQAEIVWRLGAPRSWGPYPGREAAWAMWVRDMRMRIGRDRITQSRRPRMAGLLGLLLMLLLAPLAWDLPQEPRQERAGDRVQPQAGHGAIVPARGSPQPAFPAPFPPGASPT